MVVLLKKNPDKTQLDSLTQWLQGLGVDAHISVGAIKLMAVLFFVTAPAVNPTA